MELLRIDYNGKFYGVVGKNKVIVVPYIYDEIIRTFSSGLINVCKNNKWGCLDLDGNIVIPLIYDWIFPFGSRSMSTKAKREGKWGVLNRNGDEIIPCEYDEEIAFINEHAIVTKNGNKGLVNKDGKMIIPCQFSYLMPYVNSTNYFKFCKDNKYGIIDTTGDIIVPAIYNNVNNLYLPNNKENCYINGKRSTNSVSYSKYQALHALQDEYDTVEPFHPHYGIYIVGKSNKMGVVRFNDLQPEVIIPIEYDQIKILRKTAYLLIAKKASQFRVIKVTKNNTLLSNFYDKIGDYNDNGNFTNLCDIIPVYRDNHAGVINEYFQETIPLHYDILDNHAFHQIAAVNLVMKKGDKLGVLKNTGEILLPFEFDEIDYKGIFYRTPNYKTNSYKIMVPRHPWLSSALIPVKKNNKWGLVNIEFKFIVSCIYRKIREISPNKIELIKTKGHDFLLLTKNGPKLEYISSVKLERYTYVKEFENGYAMVSRDRKVGYINEDYTEIVPCIFDKVTPYENNITIVLKNGKYGYYDNKGNEITPCIYDEATSFVPKHNIAVVKRDDSYGAINKNGDVVIPIEYKILADLSLLGPTLLMAVKEKLLGVINEKNDVIVPFEYDEVFTFAGMITVTKQNKKGVYNHKGQLIIPVDYDDIKHPSMKDTSINVCKNGKWGVLNSSGQEICSPQYDKIDDYGFACNRLAVCRDNKWGFINKKGNEIIPCIYDKVIQWFEENHCEVILNGERFVIDIHGNRISII